MYLVDTSVWIDFLRGRSAAHVDALKTLLEGEEVVGVAPIILQEVLQGAESEERFEKWRMYFSELSCYVSEDPIATHVAAARLYQQCRQKGKTPRSSNDCVIAQVAIEHALVLLHNDRDFDVIAGVTSDLQVFQP
jgi:predicted nucleic acid-binding protein